MAIIASLSFGLALYWVLSSIHANPDDGRSTSTWTWQCRENRCERLHAGEAPGQSLETCQLHCDPYAALWPRPRGAFSRGAGTLVPVLASGVSINVVGHPWASKVRQLTQDAGNLLEAKLELKGNDLRPYTPANRRRIFIDVTVPDTEQVSLHMDTSEAYNLTVRVGDTEKVYASIGAHTFYGVRHALETLGQLVVYDEIQQELLLLTGVTISDTPAFPHRGILLDTARSYFSVEAIKRTIDAMSLNKLNTFHWHITDSHSFPFVSTTYPKLSEYGAYTKRKVYTPEDISSLVQYARVRGVRIIPEFDAPAHVGEGWQWVGDNATVCFKANPWSQYCVEPPCGQLNPGSETMYKILGGIYKDMLSLFDSDVFHMGGDEVNVNCWNTSDAVTDWMEENGIARTEEGLLEVWDRFQSRAYALLAEANGKKELPVILWTSTLTDKENVDKYLDNKRYIIQIWTRGNDAVIPELIKKGFRVIFSNYDALYFDCGFGAWVGAGNNWCSPYIGWQKVYDNNVWDLLAATGAPLAEGSEGRRLVLGSEAALWSEQADESVLDGRLWPRAAALAERLWSDPKEGWEEAENRFLVHRERLVKHGIAADVVQPEWCLKNQGYCYA